MTEAPGETIWRGFVELAFAQNEVFDLQAKVKDLLQVKEACHKIIRQQNEEIENLRAEVSDLQVEQETHYCEDTAHDDCISDEQYERVIQERDKVLSFRQRVLDKREELFWIRSRVPKEDGYEHVLDGYTNYMTLLDELLESPL